MTRIAVIVAAGGNGSRMGGAVPKQFMPLAGRPVLMRTVERLAEALPGARIVVVLPAAQTGRWEELQRKYGFTVEHTLVEGGADRFHSVLAALDACGDCDLIAVHDGVRPLTSADMIRRVVAEAERSGAAVPAVTPVDSFRLIDAVEGCRPTGGTGGPGAESVPARVEAKRLAGRSPQPSPAESETSTPLDRERLRAVQTPQVFHAGLLRDAYRDAAAQIGATAAAGAEAGKLFTDDATVVERAGHTVRLCPGDRRNIKITTGTDMAIAEALIKYE